MEWVGLALCRTRPIQPKDGSKLGFAEERFASPSPILGGEKRRKSHTPPMTENGGKKGQFTSALI